MGKAYANRKSLGERNKNDYYETPKWYLKDYYRRHGHLPFRRNTTGRFSGLNYENGKEKLEAIKEKYKNEVPKETLDNFFMGRGFFREV